MPGIVLCVLFGLAACSSGTVGPDGAADLQGWQLASGKTPSKAEFAAVMAACKDKAVVGAPGEPLDRCLGNLGMKRVR